MSRWLTGSCEKKLCLVISSDIMIDNMYTHHLFVLVSEIWTLFCDNSDAR